MTSRNVALMDPQPQIKEIWDELNSKFQDVLKSGQFIMGPEVKEFEKEVADYLGCKHAIGVNSGTDALVLGLRACGVKPGDEVITTTFSFFASAESISAIGATPVFVDIDPTSYNMDVNDVKNKITSKTKAIMPVHLYGQAADMEALGKLAKEKNLKIVEDVAQAFGAEFAGKKAGTIGDVGAFSFFPSKNLAAFGDGGLITTNDDSIAEHARMLRVHGAKKKYYNEIIGYNSRLDSMQAAFLRIKLKKIDGWNQSRREAATRYHELLGEIPGVKVPRELPNTKHVYHQYTIRFETADRDQVQAKLKEKGIGTLVYYPVPQHELPVYKEAYSSVHLKESTEAAKQVLSLPIYPGIDLDSQKYVAEGIREALQ